MIKKKEFYFIRHGQTDYNVSSAKVNHEDVSLNSTGQKQALTVEPLLCTLPVKSICHSPLKRAKETTNIISSRLQAAQYEVPELSECTMDIWTDMTEYGAKAYQSPFQHVRTFIEQTLNGINHSLSQEGPVLVVAHGGIHWAICCLMEIVGHDWFIDNCLPVHFYPDASGQWKASKLL